ncbi:Por secretion system C-terminal sorting domain-containing protein [Prevotellaceae bacterium HUN156]|nr:Por secretion system C-terminal sorting domain-containing protein [Prevotellaceae bacterium HUN156]
MRKIYHMLALLFFAVTGITAEPVITITTAKQYGETLKLSPVPTVAGTIQIDWGDGNLESYEVSPSDPLYTVQKSHKVMGQTIKIYGQLSEFTCDNQQLTEVKLEEQSELKNLSLNKNQLTYYTTDLGDAYGLTKLYLAENKIEMINLRNFSNLLYLDLYGNKELTTVAFADNNPDLKGITLYDTDLVHFYDSYNFPSLTTLDLHNTSLWDVTFNPEHYPKLSTINLENNALTTLDVSGLTTLESLSIGMNQLTELNVAANTELTNLSVKGNKNLKKLNLQNNSKMRSLNVSSTGLTELDVAHMSQLGSLYVDSLHLTKLDVSPLMYLTTLSADATDLSYLDFTANYFNLRYLYLRGCKNFTAQSLNFMYNTIHNPNRSGRIYVKDTTGATEADAETYLNLDDFDSNWNIDVEGNGTASMEPVQLTVKEAEGGTYKVYRRIFSGNVWEKNYEEAVDGKVTPGYVNVIRYEAEEGKTFKGVKINGELVSDSLFFVTADAEIEAVFGAGAGSNQKYITFDVYPGQDSQYGFAADEPNTEIAIDWGDGELVKGTLSNTGFTYFDGKTEGTQVKVYGDVSFINVESYPYFGVDNRIKAIDLTHNSGIHQLNAYFNELSSIDVSNQPELWALDISMNEELASLDVTNNPELRELSAYSTEIEELNLQNNTKLLSLDVKNTFLDELNVENCKDIQVLIASNNDLEALDVTKLPNLLDLQLSNCGIESLDLTNNTQLLALTANNNKLKTLDLSKNTLLEKINVSGNELQGLDLSVCPGIWYVDVRANQWDACTVNDFMNLLPLYVSPGEEAEESTTATKLWFDGDNGQAGKSNDVAHAETVILSGKNWISNMMAEGDGAGCDRSYVYILPSENGELTLKDNNDADVLSGTTVKKGTELTVLTAPAEGYVTKSVSANGEAVNGNKFVVTKVTDVVAKFEVSTGINNQKTVLATAEGGERQILVKSDVDTEVTIVSLSGKTNYKTVVNGDVAISLPAGIYVVTMKAGDAQATKKLMVK